MLLLLSDQNFSGRIVRLASSIMFTLEFSEIVADHLRGLRGV